jgi:hypothetical protein
VFEDVDHKSLSKRCPIPALPGECLGDDYFTTTTTVKPTIKEEEDELDDLYSNEEELVYTEDGTLFIG